MSLTAAKAEYDAARQRLAAAQAAAAANKDDAALAAKVQEAQAEVHKTQAVYVEALEKNDPLSQNIEERLAKVRREEKEKLYATQEKLKADAADAEKRAAELADKLKKKEEEEEERKKTAGNKKDEPNQLAEIEKRLTEAVLKTEQEAAARNAESETKIAALQKELAAKETAAYRASKLLELGNTVVTELVTGDTKEEIDNSIIKAQQAKLRIVKEIETARAGAENQSRQQVPTPLNPSTSLTQLTGTLTAEQIRKMSPAEWAAHRTKLGFK